MLIPLHTEPTLKDKVDVAEWCHSRPGIDVELVLSITQS